MAAHPKSPGNNPVKRQLNIFISYSHWDRSIAGNLLGRFQANCQAAGGYDIDCWRDTAILPGEQWHQRIAEALQSCDFGLLLVSPYFFASPYIRTHELPHFVAPAGQPLIRHKAAIPVRLRPTNLNLLDTGGLSAQQIYHHNGKSYYETRGHQRDQFVNALFAALLQAAEKRNTQP